MQGRHFTAVLPLIFGEQCNSLQEVAYATMSLSIQGYITAPPASFGHKQKQYLYVNNRHVRDGQLGKLVNNLFRSVMSKLERPEESLRKTAYQYPAFALQIICPHSSYDITSEPDKSHVEFADWPAVLAAIQVAVLDAWHSVVGDKLLAELLQGQRPATELPAVDLTASASTDHAATASGKPGIQLMSSSKHNVRHTSPAVLGAKRSRHQEQASCFMNTDITSIDSVFDPLARQHTSHTFRNMSSDESTSDTTTGMQNNSAPQPQPLPPQAAPGGLLHRLQSSVKLKFAQTPPTASQERNQQQEHAVPIQQAGTDGANHLQQAHLLDNAPEADLSMLWSPVEQCPHQVLPVAGHRSPAGHAPASVSIPPSTSSPMDASSFQAHRPVAAQLSRMLTALTEQPCKRRAVSAPPHYRTHCRSAHTNPLQSLHTDVLEALPAYTAHVLLPDASTAQVTSVGEQAPHTWKLNRQQHTTPGVYNQLRHRLGGSGQAQISEAFRQKRHSSSSGTGQKTAQVPRSGLSNVTAGASHLPVAETALQDTSLQSDRHQLSKLKPEAGRKRMRFVAPMEDPPPVHHRTLGDLPVVPDVPTTPHLTLPAAPLPHWQGPATPMTVTPSVSAVASIAQQPVGAGADVVREQQASLAVPTVTELLQSWSNPSIRPCASRGIADLASMCGGGLHAAVPTAITRDTFKQAQTLRQMGRKFIAIVCDGTLCVIDQHAADERVRLERLRTAVLGSQVDCARPHWTIRFGTPVRFSMKS